ncbi:SH3 domain-containing protein [uncultured Oscillibacter sp.]|uniref:SH3 domain-containing protein n=1 Tax=uncultured Oscillibacter sp. TaxID=876091 RepID=UPI00260E598E|nr:SH3 domain-containing protein [uncultured Oscillibacter sp.]
MEVKNENDTAKPLAELEDIEPDEADGAGILEGAGNAESDLEAVDPFTEVNETVYATGTVNLRSGPSTAHDKVGSLNKSDSVTRVGIGTADAEGWSRIQLSDGSTVYVSNKYLSTTKPVVQQQQTSKPSGGQPSKPSESTQQQQTQQTQTETQPSDDGWSNIMKQLEELESQGYTGANVDGTDYSDADKEILGKLLNGG